MWRESELRDLGSDVAESNDDDLEPPGVLGDLVLRGTIIVVMLGTLAFVSVRAYGSVDDTSGPAIAPTTAPPPPTVTVTTPPDEAVRSTRATIALEAVISVPVVGSIPEDQTTLDSLQPEPTQSSTISSTSVPVTVPPQTAPPQTAPPQTTPFETTSSETTAPPATAVETSSPGAGGDPTTTAPTSTSVDTPGASALPSDTSTTAAIGGGN